jgi:hypothetical protein
VPKRDTAVGTSADPDCRVGMTESEVAVPSNAFTISRHVPGQHQGRDRGCLEANGAVAGRSDLLGPMNQVTQA